MSENINDINHLDTDDKGLSQIFGHDIHDLSSTPAAVKTVTPRKSTSPTKKSAPAVIEPPKIEPVSSRHEVPVSVSTNDWMPKLKNAVHGIMPPALLCTFFFWCQQTARMDATTAVVAMFGCVALVFFRVGRVCTM